jgi:hypothetical protein
MKVIAVASPVGNIVFPAHESTQKHHIAHRIAQKMLTPFFGFGLLHAQENSLRLVRKSGEILKVTAEKKRKKGIACTAYNEHIAKIAALSRGIDICVFSRRWLALIKC